MSFKFGMQLFVSGMPSGCTKNFPESWRGLGHVTLPFFWQYGRLS